MGTTITFNGTSYLIPAESDQNWGANLSNYFIAIASGSLQKTGGSFSLTSEIDFGATYGVKSSYFKSRATNPAGTGVLRLGNTESIKWRNAANTSDLDLTVNSSNQLTFNSGVVPFSGSIVDADISASAAIQLSKLAALTASRALVSNGSGVISVSSVTSTELSYLSGVTSAIQTQIDSKEPSFTTLSISKGGTNSATSLNNNRIMQSSAGAIVEAAAITAARALISDANGIPTHSTVTATELGYLSGSTGTTGTNQLVRDTSPTLVTPNIGVATATSINGSVIPTSKTLVVTTDKLSALAATTSAELKTVISDETGSGSLVFGTSPSLTTPTLDIATFTNQSSTPANPSAGSSKVYVKTSTGKLTVLDSSGNEKSAGGVSLWATATTYAVGDLALYGNKIYVCITAHTSSSIIETDLIAKKWVLESNPVVARNSMTYGFDAEDNDTGGWTTAKHSGALTNGFPTSVGSAGVALSSSTSGYTTATTLSFATTATNPLFGTYSYNLSTTSSGTTVGDMAISPIYNVPLGDQATNYSIKFTYKLVTDTNSLVNFSGLYSANSFACAIYDVTNAAWIQPAGCYNFVTKSVPGQFSATFQLPSTITQYQLVIFTPYATGATTISLVVDEFYIGKQPTSIAPAMSSTNQWVPTLRGTTTNPNLGSTGTSNATWRQVGDCMEIEFSFSVSGTGISAGSGNYYLQLPSGYTIDTAKVSNGTGSISSFGSGWAYIGTTTNFYTFECRYNNTTSIQFVGNGSLIGGSSISATTPAGGMGVSGAAICGTFKVPIVGWSSNTVSSADFNSNIVDLFAYRTTNMSTFAASTDTLISFPIVAKDSTGSFNATQDTFTVPSSGDYQVAVSLYYNYGVSVTSSQIKIYLNGSLYCIPSIVTATINTNSTNTATVILPNLVAGNTIKIYGWVNANTGAVYSDANKLTSLSITKLQGSPVVQATDTVAALYKPTTVPIGTLNNSFNVVTFTNKIKDSTNSYSGGLYTCPVSGQYDIEAQVDITVSSYLAGQYRGLAIFISGAEYISRFTQIPTSSAQGESYITVSIKCVPLVAGQTIGIYSYCDGTSPAWNSSSVHHYFSVLRSGNY